MGAVVINGTFLAMLQYGHHCNKIATASAVVKLRSSYAGKCATVRLYYGGIFLGGCVLYIHIKRGHQSHRKKTKAHNVPNHNCDTIVRPKYQHMTQIEYAQISVVHKISIIHHGCTYMYEYYPNIVLGESPLIRYMTYVHVQQGPKLRVKTK